MEDTKPKNPWKRIILLINCLILSIGNCGGPIIMRLYFVRGGKRIWFPSWLQTGGWPIILIPILISYFYRRRKAAAAHGPAATNTTTKLILMKYPVFIATAVIGLLTGLDDYLYAYGVAKLPVSTSALLIATQLAFTALFAFLLVKQKFTAYSINAIVLLTVGSGILALNGSGDKPQGESSKTYVLGFILTLAAAALYGLILPMIEMMYLKAKQAITYTLVLEIQLVMCFFATVVCTVGMIVNKDFQLGMASALETLCGQAFGAKKHHMLGTYMQRSWVVLFIACITLLPLYVYATPILKFLGQPDDVAEQSGLVALWFIPLHFSFAFLCPLQRFLQSQLKTAVLAWVSLVVFVLHLLFSWLFVYYFKFGIVGIAVTLDVSWWIMVFGLFAYVVWGGCPKTWTGFSMQAFSGIGEFFRLSIASGIMLCVENWYYRILILMTGNLKNGTTVVGALSMCMAISGWEMMIPLAFFTAAAVRVANELGAGDGTAAKFATKVSVVQSTIIGIIFFVLIIAFHEKIGFLFSSSTEVLKAADKLSYHLAITILLNSVQPVLSGVAVGSGWQSYVAYINLGCYYLIGLPVGIVLGLFFHLDVEGIWGGMIFGTAVQTVLLAIKTMKCNWEMEAMKATTHVQNIGCSDFMH